MAAERTIPIVVGVTGHRQIRNEDRASLTAAVKAELEKLKALCPHSPIVMLNSLAEGADLLCADVAESLDLPLYAVLPQAGEEYARDFDEAAAGSFAHHCDRAEQVFVAPPVESTPADGSERSYRFRQAGIYIA